MINKIYFKKLMALLLCLTMIIPLMAIKAFAEESDTSLSADTSEITSGDESSGDTSSGDTSSGDEEEKDIWDTLYPAYMATSFKSIDDRIIGNDVLTSMTFMFEKDGFALYADQITGEVIILQLTPKNADGKHEIGENGIHKYVGYLSTNPYNVGSSQAAKGAPTTEPIKEKLYSQIIIDYTQNDVESNMNSFKHAAKHNQITVKKIRSGIRVEYTIGRDEVKYLVPRLIKAEKFEALIAQIDKNSENSRDVRAFNSFYMSKDPNVNLPKKSIEDMIEKFPIVEKFPVYVCEPAITAKELLRLERIIVTNTDYSFEKMNVDHAETEWVATDEVPPLFKLALEYTIDELGLSVRCNAGNIRFDSSKYKLSNVTLLPFAGAGDVKNDGYIYFPDGSGSLIDFNKIEGDAFKISNSLYGQDYAFHTISGANKESMYLPTFGVVEIVKDQYYTEEEVTKIDPETNEEVTTIEKVSNDLKIGYLAVIEEGDSLANIWVENGGATHMFASAYTSFNPRPKDSYALTGGISVTNSMWTVESKRKYTGDYRLRYFILTEDISYSGMVNVYRKYLENKGIITKLKKTDENEDIPLYIETLGAVETTKEVFGVPIDTTVALTTFADTKAMLEKLRNEHDIKNVKVKLTGWANEGLLSLVPNGVDIEDVLGGKEEFKKLLDYAAANNITIYPDFDFAYACKDKSFDGFKSSDDLSQTIDERSAFQKVYDPTAQGYGYSGLGVISPNAMARFYENTLQEYSPYNVGAISVSTLGQSLSSDFNTDDTLHREDSKKLVTKLLNKMKQDNGKVMVSGGNVYVLPYVTDVLDVPLDDSRYKYSSGNIPFMGMVLHSYIEFTGTAINLAGDYQYTLLKTIENGASPYFIVAKDNTAELKGWSHYYSVRYAIWFNDIVTTYKELNSTLKDVKYVSIVAHQFLDKNNKVVKVTYENGTSFYINYLLKDYTVTDGDKTYTIPAENFIKVDSNGNKIG